MEDWEKLVLDPACHAVLKELGELTTKEELAQETGIEKFRASDVLKALREKELVKREVVDGKVKYKRDTEENLQEIHQKLVEQTIGGNREAIEKEEYRKAWENIVKPFSEDDQREKAARLETAQKLSQL